MVKIGLLSDTHGYVHPELPRIFESCDEIWHAGDFGSIDVAEKLASLKPLRGVLGNIDSRDIVIKYPEAIRFMCESVDVLITHIGGYPGNYAPKLQKIMRTNPPKLFISGHSHILKVMYDKKFNCLHINPGAAGKNGIHEVITMVRFAIDGFKIMDVEVVEFSRDSGIR